MGRFIKRPVEIEARQLQNGSDAKKIVQWVCVESGEQIAFVIVDGRTITGVCINTLEGTMTANIGDWIIRGVKGEFYPCKPDVFDVTYKAAP